MLGEQRSQFREDQPRIVVSGNYGKYADLPNFVFESAGGHFAELIRRRRIRVYGEGCICRMAYG